MEDFDSKPDWLEGINLLNTLEGYSIYRIVSFSFYQVNKSYHRSMKLLQK